MRATERILAVCLAALLLALAVAPYLNALENGFAFDDRGIIVENPLVREAETSIGAIFTEPYYPGALYRPVTIYTYWLNAHPGELDPFGFHLVNVVLHALVTVLFFALCRSLRLGTVVSFLAAALFAVHPIHTEAVTNVVGRAELLSTAAVLGALLCVARARHDGGPIGSARRHRWLVAAAGLFALGLLSKESAFVLLPLLVVTAWMREPKPLPSLLRSLRSTGELPVLCAVAVAYLGLRWALFGTLTVGDTISSLDNPLAHTSASVRIGTAVVVLTDSLAQLIVPLHLSADYSYNQIPLVESIADPRLLIAVGLLVVTGLLLWQARQKMPRVAGSAVFFLAAISLTANLLFPIGTIRGERLLYLPSAGFCIIAALAAAGALRRRPAWAVLGIVSVVAVFAGRTWQRNFDWASELTLYGATVASSPDSSKAHHNLGAALAEAKHHEEAGIAFRRALQIYPDYDEAAFGIGCAYQARGLMAGALSWYDEALRIDPRHAKAHLNKGVIFYNRGDIGEAAQAFQSGLDVHPGDPRLIKGVGLVRLAEGKVGEARTLLERARQIAPNDPETRTGLELAMRHTARPAQEPPRSFQETQP